MRCIPIFLVFLLLPSCDKKPSTPNKFSDLVITKIYNLKDKRTTDSLLIYLHSENPVYRREAALAFASVQDSSANRDLGSVLLEDPDPSVRKMAAFALGQTGGFLSVNALIPALQDKDRFVTREVLEAIGKTISNADANVLREFQTRDTLLQEGLAWAFYHLALRKKADSSVTQKVIEFLRPENSYQTRLAAAHYFGRSAKVPGGGFDENLIAAVRRDARPEIRMASVNGFRHLETSKVIPVLKSIYASEKDYRVRVNVIRVCQNFPPGETEEVVFAALKDSVEIVQVAASEVIRNTADAALVNWIAVAITTAKSFRVKTNLYAALLKTGSREEVIQEIIDAYPSAHQYSKAALLSALGEAKSPFDMKAFNFLSKELQNENSDKVVLTTAASAIVTLNRKSGNTIAKKAFIEVYKKAISLGDVAVIGIVSGALTDESLHYKEEIKDLRFLYDAKAKLKLPQDIESLQPLENAIAYLEGKQKPSPLTNNFNHPIDWELVKTISVSQKVEIKTTKGDVVIRLLVEDAPGSVANFVELVNKKYFDGKFFHRVVPNFVIQAGCNRGDGYGSEDYSIRSEFSLRRYTTGSVGMASSGKDTEGTQWFITHSPTPHLDGKYSIFAVTVLGMEVVDRIEVGDKIIEARLITNNE